MALSAAAKPYYKPRIDNLKAGLILVGPLVIWGIQVVLSLTGIGEIGSEILALGEDVVTPVVLYFARAYSGNNLTTKLATTLILEVAEATPFLNDVPFGVIEIVVIIAVTRAEDRKVAEQMATEAAKQARLEQRVQAARMQAAQQAAMRAQAA